MAPALSVAAEDGQSRDSQATAGTEQPAASIPVADAAGDSIASSPPAAERQTVAGRLAGLAPDAELLAVGTAAAERLLAVPCHDMDAQGSLAAAPRTASAAQAAPAAAASADPVPVAAPWLAASCPGREHSECAWDHEPAGAADAEQGGAQGLATPALAVGKRLPTLASSEAPAAEGSPAPGVSHANVTPALPVATGFRGRVEPAGLCRLQLPLAEDAAPTVSMAGQGPEAGVAQAQPALSMSTLPSQPDGGSVPAAAHAAVAVQPHVAPAGRDMPTSHVMSELGSPAAREDAAQHELLAGQSSGPAPRTAGPGGAKPNGGLPEAVIVDQQASSAADDAHTCVPDGPKGAPACSSSAAQPPTGSGAAASNELSAQQPAAEVLQSHGTTALQPASAATTTADETSGQRQRAGGLRDGGLDAGVTVRSKKGHSSSRGGAASGAAEDVKRPAHASGAFPAAVSATGAPSSHRQRSRQLSVSTSAVHVWLRQLAILQS